MSPKISAAIMAATQCSDASHPKEHVRAIGVSSARRSVAAPEVPTLIEQGIEDFDLVAWFALYAPAATPAAVIARLRDGLDRVLGNPNIASQLQGQGSRFCR